MTEHEYAKLRPAKHEWDEPRSSRSITERKIRRCLHCGKSWRKKLDKSLTCRGPLGLGFADVAGIDCKSCGSFVFDEPTCMRCGNDPRQPSPEQQLLLRAKAVLEAWDNHFANMPPSLCQDIWKTMFAPIEALREVVPK
jgi:DNA-directed RNA polymerase subunit RPC12/RpoP